MKRLDFSFWGRLYYLPAQSVSHGTPDLLDIQFLLAQHARGRIWVRARLADSCDIPRPDGELFIPHDIANAEVAERFVGLILVLDLVEFLGGDDAVDAAFMVSR
ncbi:MAG: hypothetical protein CO091_02440 [Candidatus Aquicultor secundus]|nr:MAG: hypothetical protein CO091_02440 [Candidatus Aquicultor secundus]